MICRLQKAGGCRSRDNHREENIMDRAEKALEVKHQMGINCCQAVLLAYKNELGKSEEELLRLGSGFGGGMGCAEGTCGALVGAVMAASLRGNADTHKNRTSAQILTEFKNTCGGETICGKIKGIGTGKVLCACDDCIKNAIRIAEPYI